MVHFRGTEVEGIDANVAAPVEPGAGEGEVDPRYLRPAEVEYLLADPSKARRILAWEPSVTFEELVRLMVEADTNALERRLKGGVSALSPVHAKIK